MASNTNRQVISDIVTDLRAVNLDDKVSKRYILNKLRDSAALMIKRDAEVRRILGLSDLWTEVQCVEMCEVPLIECCNVDIPDCTTVMRSRKKIPELYQTMYKELIQVFAPNYKKELHLITPQDYKDIITREFVDKRIKYFWFANEYLIIPDALTEIITIRGVFADPSKAKKLNSCNTDEKDECEGVLDQKFICPDYLLQPVKQAVLADLFNFYKRNILDEEPDLNTNRKVDKNR